MPASLKILQITNRLPYPLNDGGNIATYHVTKYLSRFGHQVILASLNTQKHYQDPARLAPLATVYTTDIDTSLSILGLGKSLFTRMPYNVSRFRSTEFSFLLEKILTEEKPDIIHLEGIYLAIYLDTLRKHTSAPVVLRSHNIEYEIWERTAENEKNILKKLYLRHLSRKIKAFEQEKLLLFDGIIAITQRDQDFYRQNHYKGPLVTIPAGVDLEKLLPVSTGHASLSMCFLGSMEWMPNLQGIEWYLEKIWPVLHQKHPSLTLHIAGKNMPEEMKARKISGVTFHGMVQDASAFLAQHKIMIVPLLSGGGMRLKIVEAMAHGQCVISTSVGAEGIEATDEQELLLANSPEEFIARTASLVTGNIQAEKIGFNARKLVEEKYSWEKLVREIENFYLELI